MESSPVKILLGCNRHPQKGFINVDIQPFPGVDVVCDLEKPWPFPDNHADLIAAVDLPEHLRQVWEEPDPELMAKASNSHNESNRVTYLIQAIQKPKRHYGVIDFMNEAFRVLKPGGLLDCTIPSTDARGWSQDPTHVSWWNENSPLYFVQSPWNLREQYPDMIKCDFKVVECKTTIPNPLGISWVKMVLQKP